MSSITTERADQDSIRIAQQFVDAYRSGAQGASMDCDAAMALALSIDDALTELRALRTQTAGEAVAWEGYWPGAGSISSTTKLTKFANTAKEWEADGADVTPLYAHNIPHPKPVEVGVGGIPSDHPSMAGAREIASERIASVADVRLSTLTDTAKGIEVTDLTLDAEELDTILAVGRNEQSGRITNYELKELVRVYSAALTASL